LILFDSMLRDTATTVSDPGSASGYPIASIKDMRAFTTWKSNQTAAAVNIDIDTGAGTENNADCIGICYTNLATLGATVRIFADAAVIGSTQVMAATSWPSDNAAILTFTAPGAKRYWRVTLNHAALPFASAPYIGELYLGMKTTLPEYLSPAFPPYFDDLEVAGERSEGGHALGATMRCHIHRGTLDLAGAAGVSRSDHTATLKPFADNHLLKRYPFFFVLDTDDTDFDDARFVKMTDAGRLDRSAVGNSWARLRFAFDAEEAFAEAVT
jgi:hypothetical protein